ncbi:hypothetical protein ANCDUO_15355 [Ancylostoma duodenale]|uniref:Protein kinase domain-containing protein n=1 Tax=Ancylostoma duodenale TaxID=51022 RepID=A0A0C2CDU2_9BILA|nr:hypothetical protein ANCDUO_15355 [Ancylostoma duodenale]
MKTYFQIFRWKVIKILGSGGFGDVYKVVKEDNEDKKFLSTLPRLITGKFSRDIKPQNFAIGLGENEKVIYMLDFGIARKYRYGDTKQVKVARIAVKFLGTIRFASRACHLGIEQGRKDDLETWLYMVSMSIPTCVSGVRKTAGSIAPKQTEGLPVEFLLENF